MPTAATSSSSILSDTKRSFLSAPGHQQHHGAAAFRLQLARSRSTTSLRLGHVGLADLHDHLARLDALLLRLAARLDRRDEHALDVVVDGEALARLVGDRAERQAEHLGRVDRRRRRRLVLAGRPSRRQRRRPSRPRSSPTSIFSVTRLPSRITVTSTRVAGRRVGDEARQLAHALHRLAVELDDDVAFLDAGLRGRAVVGEAGDEGALRRLPCRGPRRPRRSRPGCARRSSRAAPRRTGGAAR